MLYIILALLTSLYLTVNIFVNSKIDKAYYLDESRRDIHKKLIWIVPFLGALMIKTHWKTHKKEDTKATILANRKNKRGGFYESGIGMNGE